MNVVNMLDYMSYAPVKKRKSSALTKKQASALPEHIGIHLNRAYEAWLGRFVEAMNAAGHDWFTLGRANVMGAMDRSGTRQSDLLSKTGLSKQALQQMLDGLERHGITSRSVDPNDKRGRLVHLTEKGQAALADADRIKAELSQHYQRQVGQADLERLEGLLRRFIQT